MLINILRTFAAYGLPAVGTPLTVTMTRCSPTDLGTNSALKTPSVEVMWTWAGTDCPEGPGGQKRAPNAVQNILRFWEWLGGLFWWWIVELWF